MDGSFDLEPSIHQGVRYGKTIGAFIGRVAVVLVTPIVLTTQVILRKDLGERYLTRAQAVFAFALIAAIYFTARYTAGFRYDAQYHELYRTHDFPVVVAEYQRTLYLALAWGIAVVASCLWHRL